MCIDSGGWDLWRLGRMKTVAAPNRNYELKKSHKYLLNLLLFYLNNLNFLSANFTFLKFFILPPRAAAPTQSYLLVCGRRNYQAEG